MLSSVKAFTFAPSSVCVCVCVCVCRGREGGRDRERERERERVRREGGWEEVLLLRLKNTHTKKNLFIIFHASNLMREIKARRGELSVFFL